jgi:hypothetical protein
LKIGIGATLVRGFESHPRRSPGYESTLLVVVRLVPDEAGGVVEVVVIHVNHWPAAV